ncbi:MAG: hypothetical protein JSU03_00305 [Bacteroidetes bacterium]|nr:hypothetical protein [Bacteroidota bacterium]MBS1755692.1 hypothetical protein [Bacteroidota bacterium]
MRPFIAIISLFISTLCFSQVTTTVETVIADSGKYEFKLQAKRDTADYSKAFRILSNQVKLNPKNAEYRYFLGYTIDRLNADDGKGMFQLKKEMTIKASEQFEEVNKLEPVYKGELFILDPYAKLSSIWGSLAEAYLNRNLIDSAKWAFSEGRKRGGFIEPILDFNRQLLNSCANNAILVTYGDNITIPIWYLQTIENYRTDVTVVDANLINTIWYPKYLKTERKLKMSFSDAVIDTIEYTQWRPQQVTVTNSVDTTQNFSWVLRPTYMGNYILKGDRILLDIFQQNFYSRPIYFNNNSDSSYNLFLSPYLVDEGLVNRVTKKIFDYNTDVVTVSNNLYYYNIDKIKKEDILKSRDAAIILNGFRWAYFNNVYHLVTQANYDKAKELIKLMSDKFKTDKLPFTSVEIEKYFTDFFQQVDKNYR